MAEGRGSSFLYNGVALKHAAKPPPSPHFNGTQEDHEESDEGEEEEESGDSYEFKEGTHEKSGRREDISHQHVSKNGLSKNALLDYEAEYEALSRALAKTTLPPVSSGSSGRCLSGGSERLSGRKGSAGDNYEKGLEELLSRPPPSLDKLCKNWKGASGTPSTVPRYPAGGAYTNGGTDTVDLPSLASNPQIMRTGGAINAPQMRRASSTSSVIDVAAYRAIRESRDEDTYNNTRDSAALLAEAFAYSESLQLQSNPTAGKAAGSRSSKNLHMVGGSGAGAARALAAGTGSRHDIYGSGDTAATTREGAEITRQRRYSSGGVNGGKKPVGARRVGNNDMKTKKDVGHAALSTYGKHNFREEGDSRGAGKVHEPPDVTVELSKTAVDDQRRQRGIDEMVAAFSTGSQIEALRRELAESEKSMANSRLFLNENMKAWLGQR